MNSITVSGIQADAPADTVAVLKSRLIRDVSEFMRDAKLPDVDISVGTHASLTAAERPSHHDGEMTVHERSTAYVPAEPLWTLDRLIVPQAVRDELMTALHLIRVEAHVFDDWGLRKIEPFPRSALNFHGPSGMGKTMAAHGLAAEMKKQIIVASYAQIESKFHGDGPKNVEALFHAAANAQAVLFIDEADSLLSRRLTNVTQGSEQAINSLRSQLLICLEQFSGVVIFATNLVENYDSAFETRVRNIHFPLPDAAARQLIWARHLPEELPLSADVDVNALANLKDELSGREIKNVVVDTAIHVAACGRDRVEQKDLLDSVGRLVSAREAVRLNGKPVAVLEYEKSVIAEKIQSAMQPAA